MIKISSIQDIFIYIYQICNQISVLHAYSQTIFFFRNMN